MFINQRYCFFLFKNMFTYLIVITDFSKLSQSLVLICELRNFSFRVLFWKSLYYLKMLEETACLSTHTLSSNVSMEDTKCWYRWIFISETCPKATATHTHTHKLENIELYFTILQNQYFKDKEAVNQLGSSLKIAC